MTIQQPKKVEPPAYSPDSEVTTHPAYAQISIGRTTGHFNLYGSDLNHNHAIHLTISRSKHHRDLHRDSYLEEKELLEVYLSEHEWATLLSSMNIGGGVPCTLRSVMGEMVPQIPPPPSRRDQFKNEAKQTMRDAYAQIKVLGEKLESLAMPVKTRKELEQHLQKCKQELQANLPFVLEQFDEHMGATVAAGKQELIAYAQQHNLLDQLKQLSQTDPKDKNGK